MSALPPRAAPHHVRPAATAPATLDNVSETNLCSDVLAARETGQCSHRYQVHPLGRALSLVLKSFKEAGVVAHTWNPGAWEAEAGGTEFEASLVYNYRTHRVIQRNLKIQTNKQSFNDHIK